LIADVLENIERDRRVDFVRIKSTDGRFCLGRTLEDLSLYTEKEARIYAEKGQRLVRTMRGLKKLIFAEVDGEAFGSGFELAIACDMIFATERSRFSFPEVNVGVIPGFGGTQLAARKVYETFVKYLLFTGDEVSADVMEQKGIVNAVFADAETMHSHTDTLCAKLSERSVFTMGLAKETVNAGIEMDFDKALLLEQNAFTFSFSCEDKREGMGAFIEKRPPKFTNRWEDMYFEGGE
jgi:enoyl-CoA hydratase